MAKNRKMEQQIAVFGESGSGKTVLVSSFYGATQQQAYKAEHPYEVVADKQSQGRSLYQAYLGMRGSATVPLTTRFDSETYAFTVRAKDSPQGNDEKRRPFDAVQIVWHDYPGEWFAQDLEGPEADARVATFRRLLRSDVALLLVDGQRLVDNAGEEERYLKSLLANVSNGLRLMRDELLEGGKKFVEFPRIWVLALSKCDLLPDMGVIDFRDLVIDKATHELNELESTLASFIEAPEALSVGEDFILLSSAKFEPGKIEVTERVGLDLILPLAAMLPFERHVKWAKGMTDRGKVYEHLVAGGVSMAAALGGLGALATKLAGKDNKLLISLGLILTHFGSAIEDLAKMGGDKLTAANRDAVSKHENLRSTLTGFQLKLDEAEAEEVFLRSSR